MEGLNGLNETEQAFNNANIQIENGDPDGYYNHYMFWRNGDVQNLSGGVQCVEMMEKANVLYEQGAYAGNVFAQYTYSCCLGAQQRWAERLDWLRKSANGGLPWAQGLLSYDLATGSNGVPVNLQEAEYWANLAAQQQEDYDVQQSGIALLEMIQSMKNGSV